MKTFSTLRKIFIVLLSVVFSSHLLAQLEGELLVTIGGPSDAKTIVLLNAEDGSIISDSYFDLSSFDLGTVKHVIRVGDELWITDQTNDRVHRLDFEGNYLGAVGESGGMDNLRGLRIINNEIWVANSGSQNGAPGNSVIRVDMEGEIIGNFLLPGSPWAFLPYQTDRVLISFSNSTGFLTQIAEFDLAGNLIGAFTTPGELNFIQQISMMADGQYLASSFSTGNIPSGVHQYDENGVFVTTIGGTSGGSSRGSAQLSNGNIVWTNGQGIHIADVGTGTSSQIYSGSFQYVEKINFGAAVASIPFAEDFESETFPPSGWMAYNPDGSALEWASSETQNHTPGGQYSALHNYGDQGTMEDGWLVTPAIMLPEFWNIQLSFWSYNSWPGDYFKNSVLISTGDGNPLNGDFVEIWTTAEVASEWIESQIDLSDYAGETIYLAFRYEGEFAHSWYLDDVLVDGSAPVLDPPSGLEAIVTGNDVALSWEAPVTKELLGYNVYRNNLQVNTAIITETSFTDAGVTAGTHLYGVTAVYSNGESAQDGPVEVLVEGDYGKIQGFVRDAITNKSIASATLTAANTDNGTVSNSTPFGSHFVLLLSSGNYDLVCSAEGYESMMLENVEITNGMVKTYTFYLTPQTDEILTGIDRREATDYYVYPNPASGSVQLNGDNISNVKIINQAGIAVLDQKINAGNIIDISRIPAGIYFVTITSDKGISVEKLIVH
jgi:hypothetical protein